jgi:hypothetical protein
MTISRRPTSRPALPLAEQILAAEAVPLEKRVEVLRGLPIKPGDALAEAHGKALIRAAEASEWQGMLGPARDGFLAAAQRFAENDPREVYAANKFARLSKTTRSATPIVGLMEAIHDAIQIGPGNSQRLVKAVKKAFTEAFDAALSANRADALDFLLSGANKGILLGASNEITSTMVRSVARQLASADAGQFEADASFRRRLEKMRPWVISTNDLFARRDVDRALTKHDSIRNVLPLRAASAQTPRPTQ